MDGQAAGKGWIGQGMARREDARLLTGRGRFVADLVPQGALWVEFLRSPYAAGAIAALDVSDALAAPDVVAVLTGADCAGLGPAAVNPLLPGAALFPMQPMAVGRVAAPGQPVAAVVARSALAARDAVERIVLEVAEDAPEPDPVLDLSTGALPEGPGVTARVDHALVAPLALEPRASLAEWDGARLTCHLSTQTPQRCRDDLAAMLGLEDVRVVAPDVGGAFGGKASLMPEDAVVALAALRLGGAVAWQGTRSEEFLAATRGRGMATTGRLLLEGDRIAGIEGRFEVPLGHWMPYSALAPLRNASRMLPGPYRGVGVAQVSARRTAEAAVNIYRGAGRPEAVILTERLVDKAARALGLDPLEFRRRNALTPDELPARHGPCSGDFPGLLEAIAPHWAAAQARKAQGAIAGAGLALYTEPCGQGWESAALRLQPDGTVLALTGSSAQGQGRETALAQLVAEVLGIAPAQVIVAQGDTDLVPQGIGALASRSTAIGGSAMLEAARAFRARLDAHRTNDLAALAARLPEPLEVRTTFAAPAEAWASGVVLAEICLDPDTGATTIARVTWVDDAGTVLNPLLVEGQMIGGAAQGIGAALMERLVTTDGQLQTGSLMDYAVPRAADMPPLHLISRPTPTPANPLGARGVGEAGCIGIPAAILNAVMDALPADTPDLSLPLTSETVWRALNGLEP
ncbi:MAG: xanthine dehydrogenase family protein molybdopterin-binding subunit [Gemmobacter sp.]|uniref:xanthine dehydrogenase family protein molybdopterin-binding subunit n=1 Tax=Gemmobacter sp. TaxID=1898957 RepID=UPI00391C658E